jgi:hypothetical protein
MLIAVIFKSAFNPDLCTEIILLMKSILWSVFFLLPLSVFSQQVIHIENRRMCTKEDGFSGNMELSANFVQNINNIFQTTNLSQLQYKKGSKSFLLLSGFNYTLFNKKKIVNDAFGHLRFNQRLTDIITAEAFMQGQYNEIIKIRSRYLAGAGLRFRVIEKEKVKLFIGSLYMREREEEMTDRINLHHRISNYLSIGFPVTEQVSVDFISYYQPDVKDLNDFRLSGEAIVEMRLNKRISFRFAHSLFRDSNPPEGIRKTFYNFRNGLRLEF